MNKINGLAPYSQTILDLKNQDQNNKMPRTLVVVQNALSEKMSSQIVYKSSTKQVYVGAFEIVGFIEKSAQIFFGFVIGNQKKCTVFIDREKMFVYARLGIADFSKDENFQKVKNEKMVDSVDYLDDVRVRASLRKRSNFYQLIEDGDDTDVCYLCVEFSQQGVVGNYTGHYTVSGLTGSSFIGGGGYKIEYKVVQKVEQNQLEEFFGENSEKSYKSQKSFLPDVNEKDLKTVQKMLEEPSLEIEYLGQDSYSIRSGSVDYFVHGETFESAKGVQFYLGSLFLGKVKAGILAVLDEKKKDKSISTTKRVKDNMVDFLKQYKNYKKTGDYFGYGVLDKVDDTIKLVNDFKKTKDVSGLLSKFTGLSKKGIEDAIEHAEKFVYLGDTLGTMFGLIYKNLAKPEYKEARFKPPSTALSFGKLEAANEEVDALLKACCYISLSYIQTAYKIKYEKAIKLIEANPEVYLELNQIYLDYTELQAVMNKSSFFVKKTDYSGKPVHTDRLIVKNGSGTGNMDRNRDSEAQVTVFLKNAVGDNDIYDSSDINWLEIAQKCSEGYDMSSGGAFFGYSYSGKKTICEISFISYPSTSEPYVLLYNIKIMYSWDVKTALAIFKVRNEGVVEIEVNKAAFKLNSNVEHLFKTNSEYYYRLNLEYYTSQGMFNF